MNWKMGMNEVFNLDKKKDNFFYRFIKPRFNSKGYTIFGTHVNLKTIEIDQKINLIRLSY